MSNDVKELDRGVGSFLLYGGGWKGFLLGAIEAVNEVS